MRVWRVTYHHTGDGDVVNRWLPSERDARKVLAAARKDGKVGYGDSLVVPVDVPTDKSGLLEWLNANVAG